MLLFRTLNQELGHPNANADTLAPLLRDKLMPLRMWWLKHMPRALKMLVRGLEDKRLGVPGKCARVAACAVVKGTATCRCNSRQAHTSAATAAAEQLRRCCVLTVFWAVCCVCGLAGWQYNTQNAAATVGMTPIGGSHDSTGAATAPADAAVTHRCAQLCGCTHLLVRCCCERGSRQPRHTTGGSLDSWQLTVSHTQAAVFGCCAVSFSAAAVPLHLLHCVSAALFLLWPTCTQPNQGRTACTSRAS